MATMKPNLRRVELSSIVVLLAGLLCGIGIMTAVSLVHPLKQRAAAPIYIVGAPTNSQDVTGGRLGGILNSDTANDAAVRQGLAALVPSGDLPRSDEENFYRQQQQLLIQQANVGPGLRDQQVAEQLVQTDDTTIIGGRLGGLESADAPNDAAIKQAVATSIQNVQNSGAATRYGDLAGQRDANAAEQSSQADFYPSFRPGHAW